MNINFSDHEAETLEIEIKPTCGIDGDIDFYIASFF